MSLSEVCFQQIEINRLSLRSAAAQSVISRDAEPKTVRPKKMICIGSTDRKAFHQTVPSRLRDKIWPPPSSEGQCVYGMAYPCNGGTWVSEEVCDEYGGEVMVDGVGMADIYLSNFRVKTIAVLGSDGLLAVRRDMQDDSHILSSPLSADSRLDLLRILLFILLWSSSGSANQIGGRLVLLWLLRAGRNLGDGGILKNILRLLVIYVREVLILGWLLQYTRNTVESSNPIHATKTEKSKGDLIY
ncbi:hypothetical protein Tco_0785017 [Tanacetum coccineum]